MLYLGVTLFSAGMGMVIYEHINQIGHLLLIIALFATCFVSFWYVLHKALPFSPQEIQHPQPAYDYIVLLAASLLICAQGYLAYYFKLSPSGITWLALVSTIILFASAFRFDHKGVLGMGITMHGTMLGLAITPSSVIADVTSNSNNHRHLITFMLFGLLLYGYARICDKYNIKQHFVLMFTQFGLNIALLTAVVGIINDSFLLAYILVIIAFCLLTYYEARKRQSFSLLLSTIAAAYISIMYLFITSFFKLASADKIEVITLGLFFVGLSTTGVIVLLMNHKKLLQRNGE